jgi:hypothetical protein
LTRCRRFSAKHLTAFSAVTRAFPFERETNVSVFKTADELVSQLLRGVYASWQRVSAGRMAPKREEITPAVLRSALPSVWMMDVIDGGADFRFRFAGDRVVQFMGRRYGGTLLSTLLEDVYFQRMRLLLLECVQNKRPAAFGPGRTRMKDKDYLETEVVVMPLSEDGETISGLFGAMEVRPLGTAKL